MKAAGLRLVIWPLLGGRVFVDSPSFLLAPPDEGAHRCSHLTPSGYIATERWLAGEALCVVDDHPMIGG